VTAHRTAHRTPVLKPIPVSSKPSVSGMASGRFATHGVPC
jgi:hypothetical protein